MSAEQFIYSGKNSFAAGELSPAMEGRGDLGNYKNGVKKLINFIILPSGAIKRRHGTKLIARLEEDKPTTRVICNLMYNRELSVLIIFSQIQNTEGGNTDKVKITISINGSNKLIELPEKLTIDINPSKFKYASYQGVVYISFGNNYPLYALQCDVEKVNEYFAIITSGLQPDEKLKQELFFIKEFELTGSSLYKDVTYQDLRKDTNADQINQTLADKEKSKNQLTRIFTSNIAVFAGRLWTFGNRMGNSKDAPLNIHSIFASSLAKFDHFNLAYKSLLEARSPLSAFSATFTSSAFDAIKWVLPFGKEMLIASSDGIYILKTGDRTKDEFIKVEKEVDLPISNIKPVICGKTVFFVESGNSRIYSLYYSSEKGGYQTSPITTYANHIFTSPIIKILAVNSPYSMIFAILQNGSFATFTYSEDLKIMGWAQHYLGGDAKIIDGNVILRGAQDIVIFRSLREGKVQRSANHNLMDKKQKHIFLLTKSQLLTTYFTKKNIKIDELSKLHNYILIYKYTPHDTEQGNIPFIQKKLREIYNIHKDIINQLLAAKQVKATEQITKLTEKLDKAKKLESKKIQANQTKIKEIETEIINLEKAVKDLYAQAKTKDGIEKIDSKASAKAKEHLIKKKQKELNAIKKQNYTIDKFLPYLTIFYIDGGQAKKITQHQSRQLFADKILPEADLNTLADSTEEFKELTKKHKGSSEIINVTNDYLEKFECKYLISNNFKIPHTPLYADLYKHDQSSLKIETDQIFENIANVQTNKNDNINLEDLIYNEVINSKDFTTEEIFNKFAFHGTAIKHYSFPSEFIPKEKSKEIEKKILQELGIGKESDDAEIKQKNRDRLYRNKLAELTKNYFSIYFPIIQNIIALTANYNKYLRQIDEILIKYIHNKYNNSAIKEIFNKLEYIYTEIQKNYQIVIGWKLPYAIVGSCHNIGWHLQKKKYKFRPLLLWHICKLKVTKENQDQYPWILPNAKTNNIFTKSSKDLLTKLHNYSKVKCKIIEIWMSSPSYIKYQMLNKSLENFHGLYAIEKIKNAQQQEQNKLSNAREDKDQISQPFVLSTANNKYGELLQQTEIEKMVFDDLFIVINTKFYTKFMHRNETEGKGNTLVYYFAQYNDYIQSNIIEFNDKFANFIENFIYVSIHYFCNKFDFKNLLKLHKKFFADKLSELIKIFICYIKPLLPNEINIEKYQKLIKESVELFSDHENAAKYDKKNNLPGEQETQEKYNKIINRDYQKDAALFFLAVHTPSKSGLTFKRHIYFYQKYSTNIKNIHSFINQCVDNNYLDIMILFNLLAQQGLYDDLKGIINKGFAEKNKNLKGYPKILLNINEKIQSCNEYNLAAIMRYLSVTDSNWKKKDNEMLKQYDIIQRASSLDKLLIANRKYLPLFKESFPNLDMQAFRTLYNSLQGQKDAIQTRMMDFLDYYRGLTLDFIGDDQLISKIAVKTFDNYLLEEQNENIRKVQNLSFGLSYKSVMQTFPMNFPEEVDHMAKKVINYSVKFLNTSGGHIESIDNSGVIYKIAMATKNINFDNLELYMADSKYLIAQSVNGVKDALLSGWYHFPVNEPANKDVIFTYVTDNAKPACILKIEAKVKLINDIGL